MVQPQGREEQILETLRAEFGDRIKSSYAKPNRIRFEVERKDIVDVARKLKDLGFDQAASVAGTDFPKQDQFEVAYHIVSVGSEDRELKKVVAALVTRIPRNEPETPTLIPVWKSVEWHERETWEMLGIMFKGHARLEKLLLPEDWADIPPLRKEFALPGRS